MRDYEICILNAKFRVTTLIEVQEADDGAAIRSGRRFAGAQPFEVWRDIDRIYCSKSDAATLRPAA